MDFTDDEAEVYGLRSGDVLLNEASGSPKEVGKAALYRDEIVGCCFQNTLIRVRPGEAMAPEYICHRLLNDARAGRFVEHGRGVGINHLGSAKMQTWPVELPPLAEQKRIVAKLDDLLARSRATREALAAVLPLLERYRESVLAEATSGTWPSATLGSVCEESFYGPRFSSNEYSAAGVPTIRTTDMTDDGRIEVTDETPRVDVTSDKLDKFRVRKGDLLVTRTGSIGVMAVFDEDYLAIPSAYLIRFRFSKRVLPRYVFWCLMAPLGQERLGLSATAVTQSNINAEAIKRIEIRLPPLPEQQEIVRRVDAAFARIAAVRSLVEAQLARLDALDRSILARAFRGELVPQDPSDEPASALLDRIRAERAAAPAKAARRGRPAAR